MWIRVLWLSSILCVWTVSSGLGATSTVSNAVPSRVWQGAAKRVAFRKLHGNLWQEVRAGQRTNPIWHMFLRTPKYVELYNIQRHMRLRLYPTWAMVQWRFRPSIRSWVIWSWGGWKKQAIPTVSKGPSTRPTTRPYAASQLVQKKALNLWRSNASGVAFRRIAASIWSCPTCSSLRLPFLIETQSSTRSVHLLAPYDNVRFQLRPNEAVQQTLNSDRTQWKRAFVGAWHKTLQRSLWKDNRDTYQWFHLRGSVWSMRKSRQGRRVLLWEKERNATYIELTSDTLGVRLYNAWAFRRVRATAQAPWKEWKRLAQGRWFSHMMQAVLPLYVASKPPHKPASKPLRKSTSQPSKPRHISTQKSIQKRALSSSKSRVLDPTRKKSKVSRKKNVISSRTTARLPTKRVASTKKILRGSSKKIRKHRSKTSASRVRVAQTRTFPYGTIVFLRVLKKDGTKTFGTGVLIGRRFVLTVAHLLYDRKTKKKSTTLHIYPGLVHQTMPFGASAASSWWIHPRWSRATSLREARLYDLAVVRLVVPLGKKAKWLSMCTSSCWSASSAVLETMGYPLDKLYQTKKLMQWRQRIRFDDKRLRIWQKQAAFRTPHHFAKGLDGAPLVIGSGAHRKVVGLVRGGSTHQAEIVRLTSRHIQWIKKRMRMRLRSKVQKKKRTSIPSLSSKSLPDTPDSLHFWSGDDLDLDALSKE